jgi:predicted metal-binding membrane protein
VSSVRKARARLSDLELVSARCGLPAVLCGCALAAWAAVLALDAGDITLPGLCAPLAPGSGAASVKLLLTFNPPWILVISWALMIAAMTPPLLVAPLRYVGNHSFARRRKRMMTLYCAGYTTAWMTAGIALLPLSLVWRLTAATPAMPLLAGFTVAFAWQISPVKQRCLNRCHRQPVLAAFGLAADRDAFAFGLSQGAWCVGACWALMVLPLLDGRVHLIVMAAVTLLVIAERLEPPAVPAWTLRLPRKGLRIAAAQLRMRLSGLAQLE